MEEGDLIRINIPEHKLELAVSEEELAKRKEKWQPREPKVTTVIWHGMRLWLPAETEELYWRYQKDKKREEISMQLTGAENCY